MTSEQEIEILKGQIANLYGMIMSFREAEIPVAACGPNIKGEALTSDSPTSNRIVSFGSTSSGLVVTMRLGRYYFKGVLKTIGSWPSGGNVTISATTYGYISIDLTNGNAAFATANTSPGSGDDDTEIWLIFIATVADGKITELEECQNADIRCMGNA